MSEFFYWTLNMSIFGSLTGLLILVIRKIKKIPARAIKLLWSISLIRFWLPLGLPSPVSWLNLLPDFLYKSVTVHVRSFDATLSNSIQLANGYTPFSLKTHQLECIFFIASIVWIVAALSALLTITVIYVTIMRQLAARKIEEHIFVSEYVTAPAVYGVFRQRIILPSQLAGLLDTAPMEYVMLHEKSHMKSRDNLWRMTAIVTCCLHLFNPLVWVFLKYFLEDMELACDEKVLARCGQEKKKDYAAALLTYRTGQTAFSSPFGGTAIRLRVEHILSYKKLSLFSVIYLSVFLLAAAAVLLTNAV